MLNGFRHFIVMHYAIYHQYKQSLIQNSGQSTEHETMQIDNQGEKEGEISQTILNWKMATKTTSQCVY